MKNFLARSGQSLGFPELDLIIATTAKMTGVDPTTSTEQERGLHELITQVIFPALTDVELARAEDSHAEE